MPIKIRHFICMINEVIIFKDFENSEKVSPIWVGLVSSLDREAYEERITIPFEDKKFFVPKEFDYILTEIYGDYMTPPPVDEQNGHEGS